MLLRAAAEAATALLLGGALAVHGVQGITQFWSYAIPYGVLFLSLELVLRRRRGNSAMVFLFGMAFAFMYEAVYTKSVMDGLGFLGTDTGALAAALFDWGMLAVMSSHIVSARFPRPETVKTRWDSVPTIAVLSLFAFVMAMVYLIKTAFGHYVAERYLGPTWLVSDILFMAAAFWLFKEGLDRDEGDFPMPLYILAAFATWAPGNQILLEWSERFSWPAIITWMVCGGAAAGAAWGFYRFWRWRGAVDETPRRAHNFVLYAAAWRVVGAIALLAAYSPGLFDERVASAYALLIDVPTRLAFSYALLSSRLDV